MGAVFGLLELLVGATVAQTAARPAVGSVAENWTFCQVSSRVEGAIGAWPWDAGEGEPEHRQLQVGTAEGVGVADLDALLLELVGQDQAGGR